MKIKILRTPQAAEISKVMLDVMFYGTPKMANIVLHDSVRDSEHNAELEFWIEQSITTMYRLHSGFPWLSPRTKILLTNSYLLVLLGFSYTWLYFDCVSSEQQCKAEIAKQLVIIPPILGSCMFSLRLSLPLNARVSIMSINSTAENAVVLIEPYALQKLITNAAFNTTAFALYGPPPDLACASFAIATDKGWNILFHVRNFYYPRPTSLIIYVTLLCLMEVATLLAILNYRQWTRS